jgi:hypothetical protein
MVWLTASNSLGASTISQTVTIKPSPPSLWGYWPLDESEGLRHDLSGPGRHLTDPTAVGATAGKFGPALNLTKNSGHYLVQAQNNKAVNSGSLSLVGWVRPERLKDTQVVIARYEYGLKNRGYRLDLRSNEAIGFIVSPDGEFTEDYLLRVSLAEPLQVGQWYHLAAVFDGANQALVVYVDGQEVGRRTVAYPSIYPSTAPLMLGANLEAGSVTQHFEGQLDEWRIFSEALSPTAILDLFEHN